MCRHCQATCPDTIVACEKKWMLEESHLQLIQLSKSLHFFAESDPQAQTEAIHVQVEARAALAQRHVCRLHKFIDIRLFDAKSVYHS